MSLKPRTVCFIASDYLRRGGGGSGVGVYNHGLTHALAASGCRVLVVTPKWGPDDVPIDDEGVQVYPVSVGNKHWYVSKLPGLGPLLALSVREMEWSLAVRRKVLGLRRLYPISVIDGTETGNLGITTLGIPVLIRAHADFYFRLKYSGKPLWPGARLAWQLQLAAMRRSSLLAAPTRFQAREMARELRWPEHRTRLVAHFLHPCLQDRASKANDEALPQNDASPFILYTGRVEDAKGIVELLDAQVLVLRRQHISLVIAGGCTSSITQDTLRRWIADRGISEHVRYVGPLTMDRLADLYACCSVYVMPSYFETFCISILEAMAFGKPVVATAVGGVPDWVENGKAGLLVPPHDAAALADAMLAVLSNPTLSSEMGQVARHVALGYSLSTTMTQTVGLYRELSEDP